MLPASLTPPHCPTGWTLLWSYLTTPDPADQPIDHIFDRPHALHRWQAHIAQCPQCTLRRTLSQDEGSIHPHQTNPNRVGAHGVRPSSQPRLFP